MNRPQADDSDYESWLLPFADMVTFLMAFFVILYSINQVSPEKAQRIMESISVSMDPEAVFDPAASTRPPTIAEKYQQIALDIEMSIKNTALQDALTLELTPDGLTVTARSELLFTSGNAQLNPEAINVIKNVAVVLIPESLDISVEGHTDDLPINTARFPSNWELSSARAIAVLKQLRGANIAANRLRATGYAETRPVSAIEGTVLEIDLARATNRRVVLLLTRNDLN